MDGVRIPVRPRHDERTADGCREPFEPGLDADRGVVWGGHEETACREAGAPAKVRSATSKGGVATPPSVTMAVIIDAGVTSNAGFATLVPPGATGIPPKASTS